MRAFSNRAWVARILVVAGAAACGSDGNPGNDASASDAAKEASSSDAAAADATADAQPGADASDGAPADVTSEPPPTVRRPFLVGTTMRAAEATTRDDWSDELAPATDLDDATKRELARAWLDDALQEHASIAAFARFSMMMLAHGAPPALVIDSQRASLDEIRHARACFSLARRYDGAAHGPDTLRVDDAMPAMSLAELAALTAEEGCVGETLGALLAEEQAARATDPTVRALLRTIARDETRHAELAWRFVAWAVQRGGAEVARAVERAIDRATRATLAMEIRPLRVDAAAWAAHGRLTCSEARAIARQGIAEVVLPAAHALGEPSMSLSEDQRGDEDDDEEADAASAE